MEVEHHRCRELPPGRPGQLDSSVSLPPPSRPSSNSATSLKTTEFIFKFGTYPWSVIHIPSASPVVHSELCRTHSLYANYTTLTTPAEFNAISPFSSPAREIYRLMISEGTVNWVKQLQLVRPELLFVEVKTKVLPTELPVVSSL